MRLFLTPEIVKVVKETINVYHNFLLKFNLFLTILYDND